MNIMFLLIGVSLIAALVFLFLFVWAVKKGQYDDIYTPSVRILFDDNDELSKDKQSEVKSDIKQVIKSS
ncbi:MAG: cbb3-type cytochrome oxidase assembly protein CcoS [Mariniphaga sp.]